MNPDIYQVDNILEWLKRAVMHRYCRRGLLILASVILLWFVLRVPIAHFASKKVSEKIAASAGLDISIGDVGFSGFKTIVLKSILVIDNRHKEYLEADTLIDLALLKINPSFLKALTGKIRLKSVEAEEGKIVLKSDLLFTWLNQHEKTAQTDTIFSATVSYADLIWSLQNQLFHAIPGQVSCNRIFFVYKHDSLFSEVYCEDLLYRKETISGRFTLIDNNVSRACRLWGKVQKSNRTLSLSITRQKEESVLLPYLGPRWNAGLGFDTARFELSFVRIRDDSVIIRGKTEMDGLMVFHKLLSPDTLVFSEAGVDFTLHTGASTISFDTLSRIHFNGFDFTPLFAYNREKCRTISLGVYPKKFEAASFFHAIPDGLFSSFYHISVSGELNYQLSLEIPLLCPDSAKIYSRIQGKDFTILRYGETDFRLINEPFVHNVYEHEVKVASILVGEENPDFVPLDQISPLLIGAVVTSEDGAFYFHHGFNEEAFRESLAENIRQKRFARGGSTISMQLVKNVFLTQKKTITRKAEEALIVWIIENQHLVSKDRMLEVYLNIIEWGPGVYGIGPAARFYFNKKPSELTLQECLFLSSIIPRPEAFRYSFRKNGELRPYLDGYFSLMTEHLMKQGRISEKDTIDLNTRLFLQGEAKRLLKSENDSLQSDSTVVLPGINWQEY